MQSVANNSIIFIVSAPSGTGKTSLCNEVIRRIPVSRFPYPIPPVPRAGEKDGTDYYFVAPEVFKQYIAENKMAEWAEIYGNCYGTAAATIQGLFDKGCDILLDMKSAARASWWKISGVRYHPGASAIAG